MTKQEYDAKAENGTLTVRDVIKHREFATPEQLAIVDKYFKAELPTPDEFAEDMRLFGEFLDRVDRKITELEQQREFGTRWATNPRHQATPEP